ncbi:MAG TPA: hypothetical protein VM307_10075 [Egibacteraceae bacterium]|nr:hypothetical protein [Egibacteraceae bacterium]
MRRRFLAPVALLLAGTMIAGPVSAKDFTGSEERKTKRGTVYTNDVRCAKGSRADAGGVKVYAVQSGTSGGVGVCNDGTGPVGSAVPIQGRAVARGSQNGVTTYIDGDKHNQPAQLQGWARADVNQSGPTVRCGDDKGRKDASAPTKADGPEDCG